MKKALLVLFFSSVGMIAAQMRDVAPAGAESTKAQQIVALMSQGDFSAAAADFDSTMKARLPAGKLEELWNSLTAQMGAFKGQRGVRQTTAQQYVRVFVTCEFEKATLDFQLTFTPALKVAGLFILPSQSGSAYIPPPYMTPDAFRERDAVVGSGEWALPGILSLPAGDGPFPAVVLVHGSGPNDRDETVGPNKPFRDLALGLASQGIAVLRYEKRTREHGMKFISLLKNRFTVDDETVDDALAAVSLLRRTERIDPSKIFVLGHSLGGSIIPRVGKRDTSVAGLIVMAGATRPIEDIYLDQMEYLLPMQGISPDSVRSQLDAIRQQVARVKDPALSPETPGSDLLLGLPASYWLDLQNYRPSTVAATLPQRMLILQGARDYQVTMTDFDGWRVALSARPNVTFKSYPLLNHLFMEGEGKSVPAEYMKAGHIPVYVIGDIASWITR